MPSPRTIGIGFTLPCADQEKIVCRFVRETISSAVMAGDSVMVMEGSFVRERFYVPVISLSCHDLAQREPDPVRGGQCRMAHLIAACRDGVPRGTASKRRRTRAHPSSHSPPQRTDRVRALSWIFIDPLLGRLSGARARAHVRRLRQRDGASR